MDGQKLWFTWTNNVFLVALALLSLFPLVHILAISLSSPAAATGGLVKLWPVGFTLKAYIYVFNKQAFWQAFWISVQRLVLGTTVNMILTVLVAYPLSKEADRFPLRGLYVWFFVTTMLVQGGLIPWYMTIRNFGLLDQIWALILPSAVPIFHVVLLLNFFRDLPKAIEESAVVDGANHWTILFRIYLPLSLPALATITLFTMVFHWNSWFDGLILMNRNDHYPLQSYLQTVVIKIDLTLMSQISLNSLQDLSDRTVKAAQVFVGALPILIVYPFLQKYFIKGIVMGSVKG